jgi:nicotinamide phosphoribosyltransferase
MLAQFAKPGAIVACVSDSYDVSNAVENLWGKSLRDEVIRSGATVVIRPDSGDPPRIVLQTLEQLDAAFGHTVNAKGYRVLEHVRVIQGDGVNEYSIREILRVMLKAGLSATNIAFGMGGALLQQLNRDTQKFAMKLSEVTIDGKHIAVSKDPVTDHGKKSKAGRLELIRTANSYRTIALPDTASNADSQLVTVFENGELLREYTLDEIRQRINESSTRAPLAQAA